ncbi:MAG: hypothetical protein KDC98_22560 [Planctomycetes bacterium]|nr:hypothetical protein [Planctomycetota bacterium]
MPRFALLPMFLTCLTAAQGGPQVADATEVVRLLAEARAGSGKDASISLAASARALDLAKAHVDAAPQLLAQAACLRGRALIRSVDYAEARKVLDVNVGFCADHGLQQEGASSHLAIANLELRCGRIGYAKQHAEYGMAHFGSEVPPIEKAEGRFVLGACSLLLGAAAEAVAQLFEALELAEQHEMHALCAEAHLLLASMCLLQEVREPCEHHIAIADDIIRIHELELLRGQSMILSSLLNLSTVPAGELEASLHEARTLGTRLGNPLLCADALRTLGHVARAVEKDPAKGIELYRQAFALVEDAGDLTRKAYLVCNIAETIRRTGDAKGALAELAEHDDLLAAVDFADLRIAQHRVRCQAHASLGEYEAAHASAWIVADTERWLHANESTAMAVRWSLEREHGERELASRKTIETWAGIAIAVSLFATMLLLLHAFSRRAARRQQELNQKLETAMSQVKQLRGMMPICSGCKSVRDDAGYWRDIESYVREHTDASFSHGLCPTCAERLYPDLMPGIRGDEPTPGEHEPADGDARDAGK